MSSDADVANWNSLQKIIPHDHVPLKTVIENKLLIYIMIRIMYVVFDDLKYQDVLAISGHLVWNIRKITGEKLKGKKEVLLIAVTYTGVVQYKTVKELFRQEIGNVKLKNQWRS